jgi:hypothetical protein
MNSDAQKLTGDLLNILEYPLVQLGNSNVMLANLIVFACAIALVFLSELVLRRYLIRRFHRRTHISSLPCSMPSARLPDTSS